MSRLAVTQAPGRVVLVGRLDDTASLTTIAVPPGDVAIDTGGVTFVNSVGMREWIRFVRALAARGNVTLDNVADVLMTQMNMIEALHDLATVRSFHAQYACGACGAESAPLVDAVAHAAELAQLRAPSSPCPECGAAMQLADYPERYLMMFRAKAT